MCRHLAYAGAPASPAYPLLDAPHSLRHQSYAPRDMRSAAVSNADGFGLGWYETGGAAHCYRRDCPMWTDRGIDDIARSVRTTAFLAAVRSATVGMPVVETACAPFTDGHWLFSHNGVIVGWPGSVADIAATELSTVDLLSLDAPTDSALLWALVRSRLARGDHPERVLAGVTTAVGAAAPGSRLNLLLTDGSAVYATAYEHSLVVRAAPKAVLVSSEPVDGEPGWEPVADRTVLTATPDRGVRRTALEEGAAA